MALSTAHLREELLAALNIAVAQVAGSRNGQRTVPHHELVVLLVAHLLLAAIVGIVQKILLEGVLIGYAGRIEHLVDTLADALVGTIGIVGMQDACCRCTMLLDILDDLVVLALRLRPGGGGVEPVTVAAGHVGDVPDGIGTGTVLQRATGHGVGELLQRAVVAMMLTGVVVGSRVVGGSLELAGSLVPHGRVELDILRLLAPLFLDGFVVDGIEQSGAIDSDGRLQAHLIVGGLGVGVEGRLRDGDLRIDE